MGNSGWQRRRLAELCESVDYGFTTSAKDTPIGPKFLRITDIVSGYIDWNDVPYCRIGDSKKYKYHLAVGDIVIARTGATTGYSAYLPYVPDAIFASYLIRLRIAPPHSSRFVSYYLKGPQFWEYMHGVLGDKSAQPNASAKTLTQAPVNVPPPVVQRRIAAILGALDDKIELNRRMSRALEAMARALFKSWFVDFEPVRARTEGRETGLPAEIADLFPDRLVDCELGEIPDGWDAGTLADFAALNPESWSKDTRPEVIRYVDLSNTKWGRIETVTTHTRHDAPSRAQRVLRPGDTLVGTVRPGNGSYTLVAEEGLTGSTGFAVLRPQKAEWAEFVYLAATAASNIDALAHLADGAAYPAVRPEVVAATPVVRPGDRVLGEFSKYAAPLLARMARSERESRILASLRDVLLPRLLSGEIDVSGLEGLAEEVAEAPRPEKRPTTETRTETIIYTIGHSNHPIEQFIGLLRQHGITAIADVRSSPHSRHNPQFNAKALAAALKKAGIAYVFLGEELGARPKDPACYVSGRVDFGRLAAREEFRRGIERVLMGAEKYRLALMCAEKDPLDCHRTILICRHLRERGVRIKHILADGSVEDHHETEARLLKVTRFDMPLFGRGTGGSEALGEAYAQRAAEIAYNSEKGTNR